MGFEWNFCQGPSWFRIWITLGLVHGDISGSEIDFEPGGGWSFEWELFVEDGEERDKLCVGCPTFSFALRGSVAFEVSEGGGTVLVEKKEGGFEVKGRG